ncbi:predicted protein [Histoplasma mississippiense (nom. inval.)]|uniref:predicted protein n=1 Tax=Ajellomyces capsulatus (strain NAm1 / WU24) TaxID=2059318 RepID=UPI000157B2C1|nr:predicted protein [Histoplasma mississippiense (nom. inval.)]EDN02298.1 predicted protein [Histoplasma mississippiense (nom. inval.)]
MMLMMMVLVLIDKTSACFQPSITISHLKADPLLSLQSPSSSTSPFTVLLFVHHKTSGPGTIQKRGGFDMGRAGSGDRGFLGDDQIRFASH